MASREGLCPSGGFQPKTLIAFGRKKAQKMSGKAKFPWLLRLFSCLEKLFIPCSS
jgi:hypothetical protein